MPAAAPLLARAPSASARPSITVLVWTAFIVIARASAARSLTPFDIAFARICGASLVLLPWGAWLVRAGAARRRAAGAARCSACRRWRCA